MSLDAYEVARIKEEMRCDGLLLVAESAALENRKQLIDHARNQLLTHYVNELVGLGITQAEIETLCVQAKLSS